MTTETTKSGRRIAVMMMCGVAAAAATDTPVLAQSPTTLPPVSVEAPAARPKRTARVRLAQTASRGRWPTLMVLVTVQLSVSITETVLLFSFET